MTHIGVVNEQIVAFPTKLDVGVFALIIGKTFLLESPFPCVVVPSG